MADESSKDYQASQSRHAEKIRTERTVMEMTGKSRSQIREGLARFAQQRQDAQLAQASTVDKGQFPPSTVPPSQGSRLALVPFSTQPSFDDGKPADPGPNPLENAVIILNGQAYYPSTIYGILGPTV